MISKDASQTAFSARADLLPLFNKAVIVAALGYFVDLYDLVLFSIVRIDSLKSLGFSGTGLTDVGVLLLNVQMAGLLLGGILWGVLGDKRGRLSVLFASIALYSIANLLNAFVESATSYAVLRFLAGVGLAGELGAAITLVSESLPARSRGYAAAFIAGIGLLGAISAGLVARFLDWRMAYGTGGVMGLCLLLARARLADSPIFTRARNAAVEHGNPLLFFRTWERARRYLATIAIGLPCWYVLGILLALGPELTEALGVQGTVVVGTGVMCQYIGAAVGDLSSGVASQRFRNRNKVVAACVAVTLGLSILFLLSRGMTPSYFYWMYFCLGISTGYWAVFMTVAAEQFGTNLRATAASTAPNFVRGAVIPMTIAIQALKGSLGLVGAVAAVGLAIFAAAFWALRSLRESYAADLDFLER